MSGFEEQKQLSKVFKFSSFQVPRFPRWSPLLRSGVVDSRNTPEQFKYGTRKQLIYMD